MLATERVECQRMCRGISPPERGREGACFAAQPPPSRSPITAFHERPTQVGPPVPRPGRDDRHTASEDYTTGELSDPFPLIPTSRRVDGSQWHALTFVGSNWGTRDTRHPESRWSEWIGKVTKDGGVVTLDVGPNWDPAAGPIGSISGPQLRQLEAIQAALTLRR